MRRWTCLLLWLWDENLANSSFCILWGVIIRRYNGLEVMTYTDDISGFLEQLCFHLEKNLIFIGDMIGTDDSTVVCCLPLKQKEISNPHWRSMGKKSEKMSQGCGSPAFQLWPHRRTMDLSYQPLSQCVSLHLITWKITTKAVFRQMRFIEGIIKECHFLFDSLYKKHARIQPGECGWLQNWPFRGEMLWPLFKVVLDLFWERVIKCFDYSHQC